MKPAAVLLLVATFSPALTIAGLPGPQLVKDIRTGIDGALQDVSRLAAAGNQVFTAAHDGTTGYELWRTDGTAAGTVLLKDIRTGSASSTPHWFMAVGNQVYFAANAGSGDELWKSDGTAVGTANVINLNGSSSSYPRPLFAKDSFLYFSAADTGTGIELWKTDGSAAGTILLKDIAPGSAGSGPSSPVEFKGILYFVASSPDAGKELWRTDGSPTGTFLVKDLNPGSASADPANLTVAGSLLYFTADDGVHGKELWRTDGTVAGTALVKDIGSGAEDGSVYHAMAAGNFLYFSAKPTQPETSWALWRSDGTEAGTIPLLPAYNYINAIQGVGNTVYFSAQVPGNPARYWSSQGTVESTLPNPEASFYLASLHPWGSGFCSLNSTARSLWQNDGPGAKPYEIADLSAGSTIYLYSFPCAFTGGKFYLHSSVKDYGWEISAYDMTLPSVAKPEPAGITGNSAVLKGAINPNGSATTAKLEFGPGLGYGTTINLSFTGNSTGTLFLPYEIPITGLTSGSTYYYKVTATSPKGTRTATGTFRTGITLGDWRREKFGVDGNTGIAADDQDPDHDGLINLIEYAFRLDPLRWDAANLPKVRKESTAMVFEFTRPEGLEDVNYGVEWSVTLLPGSWTPVTDTGSGNQHSFRVPTFDKPNIFMRWTVTPR
jgi:ELWxxDGT repeat protein